MARLNVMFIKDIKRENALYVDAKCIKSMSFIGARRKKAEKSHGFELVYYCKRDKVWLTKHNDKWSLYSVNGDMFPKYGEYSQIVVQIS